MGIALTHGASSVGAQELEPRAYRALPVGLHFGLLVYSFSTGNVVVDPTTPIEGLELDVNTLTAGYLTTFPLFNRSSAFSISLPYVVRATGGGALNDVAISETRSGPADARLRLSHLVIGGAAQRLAEFAPERHRRTVGVGLTVSAPTGNYSSERLINAGANRWGFKPEIGTTIQRGRWINEIALGVWLFTANTDGPFGLTKTQDPLGSLQFHFSYNLKNGMWLSIDGNYFTGGAATVEGFEPVNRESNSRLGLTLSIPLSRKDSLKLAGHTGAFTRAGIDFNVGILGYQRMLAGGGAAKTNGE
jgi:hypothetical protein